MEQLVRLCKRLGYVLLLLLAAPMGLLGAVAGFFALAFIISSIPVLVLSGALALMCLTIWLSRIACRGLFERYLALQRWAPVVITSGTLFIVGSIAVTEVFQLMTFTYLPKELAPQTAYWDLPTGSRLAYMLTPAQGTPRPTPVIMLHGGPGAPGNSFAPQPADQRLAAAGFNVYQYDQVGAGASARLENITQYTVARHVADLEAIRQKLGAERLILVGGSWGGTLAAHYLAAHPDRVEKVVFSSPRPIWAPAFAETGSGGNANSIVAEMATLRFVVVFGLQQINPAAAQNLAPDTEMSAFFQQIVGRIIASDVDTCNPQGGGSAPQPVIPRGFGYYVNMMTSASIAREADPRPALANNATPALILQGECDRMRPEVHQEYRDIFKQSILLVVEDVGHSVARSPHYADILYTFVIGQPPAAPGFVHGIVR